MLRTYFEKANSTGFTASKLMSEQDKATYVATLKQVQPALYAYGSARFNSMLSIDDKNTVDKAITDMAFSALAVIIGTVDNSIRRSVEMLDKLAWATLKEKRIPVGDAFRQQSVVKTCKEVLNNMRDKHGTKLNGVDDVAYENAVNELEQAQAEFNRLKGIVGNYKVEWDMNTTNALMTECDKVFTAYINQNMAKTPAQIEKEKAEKAEKRKAERKAKAEKAKAEKAKAKAQAENVA